MRERVVKSLLLLLVVVCAGALAPWPSAASPAHQAILGSGSTFAENANNIWISEVTRDGLRVWYSGTGSGIGRRDFGNGTADFAVTDIPYQGVDAATGYTDTPCVIGQPTSCRAFTYIPNVGGATAATYHLEVNGHTVRDLRLSGSTLAKIFTGAITSWSDQLITADNNGYTLPDLPIVPIVDTSESFASWTFTQYLADQFPALWNSYTGRTSATPYLPIPPNGKGALGAGDAAADVAGADGNGSISLVPLSYALARNEPVASLRNAAGYFATPLGFGPSIALSAAQIKSHPGALDDGSANLHAVFENADPRSYPLSAYTYMLVATSATDPRFASATAKWQTLADFIYHAACNWQNLRTIGYAPLPVNLIRQDLKGIAAIEAADPNVDLTADTLAACADPTAELAAAPQPEGCTQSGHGPCDPSGFTAPVDLPTATAPVAGSQTSTSINAPRATATGSNAAQRDIAASRHSSPAAPVDGSAAVQAIPSTGASLSRTLEVGTAFIAVGWLLLAATDRFRNRSRGNAGVLARPTQVPELVSRVGPETGRATYAPQR